MRRSCIFRMRSDARLLFIRVGGMSSAVAPEVAARMALVIFLIVCVCPSVLFCTIGADDAQAQVQMKRTAYPAFGADSVFVDFTSTEPSIRIATSLFDLPLEYRIRNDTMLYIYTGRMTASMPPCRIWKHVGIITPVSRGREWYETVHISKEWRQY